jgi:hypothetical protein
LPPGPLTETVLVSAPSVRRDRREGTDGAIRASGSRITRTLGTGVALWTLAVASRSGDALTIDPDVGRGSLTLATAIGLDPSLESRIPDGLVVGVRATGP